MYLLITRRVIGILDKLLKLCGFHFSQELAYVHISTKTVIDFQRSKFRVNRVEREACCGTRFV